MSQNYFQDFWNNTHETIMSGGIVRILLINKEILKTEGKTLDLIQSFNKLVRGITINVFYRVRYFSKLKLYRLMLV